jgi:hypothetical protein
MHLIEHGEAEPSVACGRVGDNFAIGVSWRYDGYRSKNL